MSEPMIVRDHTGEPVLCTICEGTFTEAQHEDRHTIPDGDCHSRCCDECEPEPAA